MQANAIPHASELGAFGPRLTALIAAGHAYIDGPDIIGRSPEGEVLLGSIKSLWCRVETIEAFLTEYPEPSQW